jgi:hypothetical protein
MTGYLQNKVAVPPLIYAVVFGRLPNGQATQNEGSRAKPQVLFSFPARSPHNLTAFRLPKLLLGNDALGHRPPQKGTGGFHAVERGSLTAGPKSGVSLLQHSPRVSAAYFGAR